jgi:long-chain acyl-CoA synthetase
VKRSEPGIRRRTAVAAEIYFGIDREAGDRRRLGTLLTPVVAPLFLNAFPFSRRRSIRKSLSLMGELLDEGWSVVLYPEGARSEAGELLPFKPGVGMIASEMLVPVVPIKLSGSFRILPVKKLLPFKERVKLAFGKPLFFQGRHDYETIAVEVKDAIRLLSS